MPIAVLIVILIALILFVIGKPRYDIVSLLSLLALIIIGAVDVQSAFEGFSHAAVITVIAVLVISAGILKTGYIDIIINSLNQKVSHTSHKILVLMTITAFLSSFMNNVGALALVIPITMSVAKQAKQSPSIYLMPVAMASLLGGLITKIGTPPNLLISDFRVQAGLSEFGLFDYSPIGIIITLICILFVSFWGWRLVPQRVNAYCEDDPYKIDAYISEIVVPEKSTHIGNTLQEMLIKVQADINILSIIRNGNQILTANASEFIVANDILVVKAEHSDLQKLLLKTDLRLKHLNPSPSSSPAAVDNQYLSLVELILKNESPLIGKNLVELDMRNTLGVNLVAISRKGVSTQNRLKDYPFEAGDVLLIQVNSSKITSTCSRMGAIPLAHRNPNFTTDLPNWKKNLSIASFIVAILLNAFNVWPIQLCFAAAALVQVVFGILTTKEMYDAIEWPIVAMLGCLIPLGIALETSGTADMLADILFGVAKNQTPLVSLGLVMALTLLLTNLINNSAAVVIMAPIGIALAHQLNLSVDPFLMGVALSASSAHMTPIGHQSNTLIMGPGGFKFTDYWQLGLPVSLITLLLGAPLITLLWPL